MRYRLVMHQTDRRWLELPGGEFWGNLDFGLELPEGARVHSIVPAVTERQDVAGAEIATVTEWAVFVAVPLEELEPELAATATESVGA